MHTFFCRLLPPRVTFAQDMTGAEAALMQQHAVYWDGLLERRRAITFGLVADPAGAHGIAVVEVEHADEVRTLTEHDPTIVAGRGFRWEIFPMPFGAAHV